MRFPIIQLGFSWVPEHSQYDEDERMTVRKIILSHATWRHKSHCYWEENCYYDVAHSTARLDEKLNVKITMYIVKYTITYTSAFAYVLIISERILMMKISVTCKSDMTTQWALSVNWRFGGEIWQFTIDCLNSVQMGGKLENKVRVVLFLSFDFKCFWDDEKVYIEPFLFMVGLHLWPTPLGHQAFSLWLSKLSFRSLNKRWQRCVYQKKITNECGNDRFIWSCSKLGNTSIAMEWFSQQQNIV